MPKMVKKYIAVIFFLIFSLILLSALLFYPDNLFSVLKIIRSILLPLVLGAFFAFILNKPVCALSRIFKKFKPITARIISTFIVLFAILFTLIILSVPLGRSLSSSIELLSARLPLYISYASDFLSSSLKKIGINISPYDLFKDNPVDIVGVAADILSSVTDMVNILLLSLVFSVYMVIYKSFLIKQLDKLCFAVFSRRTYFLLQRVGIESDKVFSGYFSGKLLQCLIVFILTFFSMWIIGLPYAMPVSLIMGVFNIISLVGPIIGAIPCVLLLVLESYSYALWFIVISLVVQLIAGQILGPRLLGDMTGLPSFWVFLAVIVGGAVGGVMGMLLGVPIFAVLYIFVKEAILLRIRQKDSHRFESDDEWVYNKEE